jgi:hypothetical protein
MRGGLPGFVEAVLGLAGVEHLAPWMGSAGVVMVALLALPLVRLNLHTDRARRLLKEASRARGAERERLEAEALAVVAGHPQGLVVVADTALAAGRRSLAEAALAGLKSANGSIVWVRRLERALAPDLQGTPLEIRIRADQLRENGLDARADELLGRARAKWPGAEELREG